MMAEFQRRFKTVARHINEFIGINDVYGLEAPPVFKLVEKRQYQFLTDPQKLENFRQWLQLQIDLELLQVTGGDPTKPWTADYIESAYSKGLVRAYVDARRADLIEDVPWYRGTSEQFLLESFSQRVILEKVQLLSTRAFEQMRGVTTTMSQQMNRILSEGLVNGWGARKTAREMTKAIGALTKNRALMIARTEIVHAQAEGQLDGYTRLGISQVRAKVEWLTAGDPKVCDECLSMEGKTFTVAEAHGWIPLHPNCRCAWIPYHKDIHEEERRQRVARRKRIQRQRKEARAAKRRRQAG
jgi:SPP1 gp7 family putative phage head morphogenesis protein